MSLNKVMQEVMTLKNVRVPYNLQLTINLWQFNMDVDHSRMQGGERERESEGVTETDEKKERQRLLFKPQGM